MGCSVSTSSHDRGVVDRNQNRRPDSEGRVGYLQSLFQYDGRRVHIRYPSIKDFLIQNSTDVDKQEWQQFLVNRATGSAEIARTCLDHIGKDFEKNGSGGAHPLTEDTFLDYATLYWPAHLAQGSKSKDNPFDYSQIFWENTKMRETWWIRYWRKSGHVNQAPSSFTAMHIAAYFGISALALDLLEPKIRLNGIP